MKGVPSSLASISAADIPLVEVGSPTSSIEFGSGGKSARQFIEKSFYRWFSSFVMVGRLFSLLSASLMSRRVEDSLFVVPLHLLAYVILSRGFGS